MSSYDSQRLIKESIQYKDVVFTEVYEDYYNLTLKTFAVFDFAYKQCPNVECIVKADSDNVLNIKGFEDICQKQLGYIFLIIFM